MTDTITGSARTPALGALRRLVEAAQVWDDKPSGDNSYELSMACLALRKADPDGTLLTRLLAEAEAGRAVLALPNKSVRIDAIPTGDDLDERKWRVVIDAAGDYRSGYGPTLAAAIAAALQDEATEPDLDDPLPEPKRPSVAMAPFAPQEEATDGR